VRLFRLIVLLPLVPFLTLGPVAAHRAYFQVRALGLEVPAVIEPGATVRATATYSGRTTGRIIVELVQGTAAETLASSRVPANRLRFWDPRAVEYVVIAHVTAERLSRFSAGPAVVRVTGHGAGQWMRVPPPEIRERPVRLEP
jgi:hypothetical protein